MKEIFADESREQAEELYKKAERRYKLICADIDGTLLNDAKELLPQVKESLRNAAKKGIHIALASGRMPAGVEAVEEELGMPCIKICNAGTYIILGEQCISMKTLLPETVESIYFDIAKKNHLPLWIFQEKEWYVTDIDHYIEREIKIVRYQPEVVSVEKMARQWEEENSGPNKLLIAADPEIIEAVHQEMADKNWPDIDMACSSNTYLEIFPRGVTKGTALSAVCDRLNISLEDTIAFGDHELDIPMIEKAGVGIAMGNAIDELKEQADFVTKTNNAAGIAYALEYYLAE